MFTRFHLKLARNHFKPVTLRQGLAVVPVKPVFSEFMRHIEQIGDDWHLREEFHQPEQKAAISQAIENGQAWLFKRHGVVIGCCYSISKSHELTHCFRNAVTGGEVVEIFKIGLYEGLTGHGWGPGLISKVLDEIFTQGADWVYLNTRDSNHVNSVPFYEALGFEAYHSEVLPDDLIILAPQRKLAQNHAAVS